MGRLFATAQHARLPMVKWSDLHTAWSNLITAKLRSFLAILGILVGTAAIVALMSSGRLATEQALAQFKTLGTDLIAISVFQQHNPDKPEQNNNTIPLHVWRQLPHLIPGVRQVAPYNTTYLPINFQGKTLTGAIVGADETLAQIIHIDMAQGHFVSFVESFEHYCVIGHALATELQQIRVMDPIGQQIQIGQTLYTIIGVAQPWRESSFFNEDINHAVIIPIAGMALINQNSQINNAILWLQPNLNIDKIILQIKQTLNQQAPQLSIFIRSAKQIIVSMQSQSSIFNLLLTVIGSIALVVGGIGVMNIMLVSVSERKKEIGLRKALGANNRDIQSLFLVESVLLASIGGLLGVLFGLIITWVVATMNGWPYKCYISPLLIGFFVSTLTGIFFGFYPAKRAARLMPIESLRSA